MSNLIGKTILHYRIVEKLGEGGMGVVYKAEDTKLERTVALKFLSLTSIGEEEKKRFKREAKAAASLNHPNIATVFAIDEADDQTFIAMEFIEGKSLHQIINTPLRLDDAIDYATQIAAGLQAAHEKGITHRDIKSANIMVTDKGVVKIMDFGLAKLAHRSKLTQLGTTLGTAAYMSPEQSRGENTDHRSDIWSLGVVLYEMISGQMPFKGDYEQAVIYSIQNEEPEPLTAVRTGVPMKLEEIVNKLLAKDPRHRYQNIIELPVDLKNFDLKTVGTSAMRSSMIGSSVIAQNDTTKKKLTVQVDYSLNNILKYIAIAVLFFAAAWFLKPGTSPQIIEAQIAEQSSSVNPYYKITISPDGKIFAYIGSDKLLNIRRLDSVLETKIPDTEGASRLIFSPDGKEVGYYKDGKIWKVPVEGGKPFSFGEHSIRSTMFWGADNNIYFYNRNNITRIPSSGVSQGEQLISLDSTSTVLFELPIYIPNSNKMIYTISKNRRNLGESDIRVLNLDTKQSTLILKGGVGEGYIKPGYLIYATGIIPNQRFVAVEFDHENSKLGKVHVPVLEDALTADYSESGSIIYVDKSNPLGDVDNLVLVDRNGESERISDKEYLFTTPSFSPDGKKIAVRVDARLTPGIWTIDPETDLYSKITNIERIVNPVWSLDGSFITYRNIDEKNILHIPIDKSREPQMLVDMKNIPLPLEWFKKDGHEYLLFQFLNDDMDNDNIGIYSTDKDTSFIFLETPAREFAASASPDGSYIAYGSDVSGQNEIYVRSFPASGGATQVTIDGGIEPVWSPKRKELFFRKGAEMWSAEYVTDPGFRVINRTKLFEGEFELIEDYSSYDVHPDGDKFLMVRNGSGDKNSKIMVVTNWITRLKEKFGKK